MKIFYAVQATGNGHISRAMELVPYLQRHGTVDIFLSGDNSNLAMDLPVMYRSKGLSLYYNSTGGLDYWKIIRGFHPFTLRKDINELPVEKYDMVINDFEYITAAACAKKKIPSIQLGHQASFQSRLTPRPENKNAIGEWLLRNYAKASDYIGLHFEQYDNFIFNPVIKKELIDADATDKNHITVYLVSYSEIQLENIFGSIKDVQFQLFTRETKEPHRLGNLHFFPVNKTLFNQSLIHCSGIICGAGFETPAEALHLGKKVLVIPVRGQYEQQCNAASLERMGVPSVKKIDKTFPLIIHQWLQTKNTISINYRHTIPLVLERLFTLHENRRNSYEPDVSEAIINLQELLSPSVSGQF